MDPADIYDSQVKVIDDKIMPWIESMQGSHADLEDFRRRLIDKFRDQAGLEVDVKCYYTDEEGTIAFDVDIVRNLMPIDRDQQVHEVVHNVLDIPEDRDRGLIKTDPTMIGELGAEKT